MRKETLTLLTRLDQYGKIILGVDFDDTIFPYTEGDEEIAIRCEYVIDLVKRAKPWCHICLWTLGDYWSVRYKTEIMKLNGINPDYVNASPFEVKDARKPYFNLLLDDNAGINEGIEILEEFLREVNIKPKITSVSGSAPISSDSSIL